MKLYLLFLLTLLLPRAQICASRPGPKEQAAAAAASLTQAEAQDLHRRLAEEIEQTELRINKLLTPQERAAAAAANASSFAKATADRQQRANASDSDDDNFPHFLGVEPPAISDFCSEDEREVDKEASPVAGKQTYPIMSDNLRRKALGLSKEKLSAFLKKNPRRVEMTGPNGETLLMATIRAGKWSKLNTVLGFKPDVHRQDNEGDDALSWTNDSDKQKSVKAMKVLLKKRANPLAQHKALQIYDFYPRGDRPETDAFSTTLDQARVHLDSCQGRDDSRKREEIPMREEKFRLLTEAAAQQQADKVKSSQEAAAAAQ